MKLSIMPLCGPQKCCHFLSHPDVCPVHLSLPPLPPSPPYFLCLLALLQKLTRQEGSWEQKTLLCFEEAPDSRGGHEMGVQAPEKPDCKDFPEIWLEDFSFLDLYFQMESVVSILAQRQIYRILRAATVHYELPMI